LFPVTVTVCVPGLILETTEEVLELGDHANV
jgi:hypothetical protein